MGSQRAGRDGDDIMLKVPSSMLCDLERSQAEPFDGREDVIGGFVPSEGFGIFVDDVDGKRPVVTLPGCNSTASARLAC